MKAAGPHSGSNSFSFYRLPSPFPRFEINTLPADQVAVPSIMMEEANWFQNLEGDIDSSHIDYLHSRLRFDSIVSENVGGSFLRDRAPRLEVVPTPYGAFYSAKRKWDQQGNEWHRITQFIFPFHTMIAASTPNQVSLRSFVPLDDHYGMLINQSGHLDRKVTEEENKRAMDPYTSTGGYVPATSDPRSRYFTVANKSNDYKLDLDLQKTELFIGVATGGNLQDRAMTELMTNEAGIEPIYDRSKEHLGRTDSMVIMTRRIMLAAARALQNEGKIPANVDNADLDAVRSTSVILPENANWIEASENARRAAAELPVVYVVPN